MTLDEKIGQLFLLAFSKNRLDEARVLFEDHFVGAAYISNDNVPDPQSAVTLTTQLQQYAGNTRLGLPLLVGADQEGAWGVMVPASCTGPGNMALGATANPRRVAQMYQVIGEELASVGINTLFAPCADCNSNPHNSIIGMRAFGEKPALVGALTAAAVQGAQAGGVVVAIKHFPGHGDTTLDSHRGLPTVSRTRAELFKTDLFPFQEGIRAGADMVMTAHIVFTALDPDNPATLSKTVLQDVLRGDFDFKGVVLSDSMNMGAMKRNYRPEVAVVQALLAGVDVIMLAEEHYDHNAMTYVKQQIALLDCVKHAVEDGTLPISRIDQAVERVLTLRAKHGLLTKFDSGQTAVNIVGSAGHRAIELQVSRDAVGILRDVHHLLPISDAVPLVLINTSQRISYAAFNSTRGIGPNQTTPAFDYFVAVMQQKASHIRVISAEMFNTSDLSFDDDALLIAVTENYPLPGMDFDQTSQPAMLHALAEQYTKRLIVVALRDPYELSDLPDIEAYLCAFSFRPSAAQAAVNVLFGEYAALGKSPVTVLNTTITANESLQKLTEVDSG